MVSTRENKKREENPEEYQEKIRIENEKKEELKRLKEERKKKRENKKKEKEKKKPTSSKSKKPVVSESAPNKSIEPEPQPAPVPANPIPSAPTSVPANPIPSTSTYRFPTTTFREPTNHFDSESDITDESVEFPPPLIPRDTYPFKSLDIHPKTPQSYPPLPVSPPTNRSVDLPIVKSEPSVVPVTTDLPSPFLKPIDRTPSARLDSTMTEPSARTKFLQNPSNYINTVDKLQRDGSNINDWIDGIDTIGELVFGVSEFTSNPDNLRSLSASESMPLKVFFSLTIDRELRSLISSKKTAADAFETLKKNFQLSSRIRKIELWDEILFKLTVMDPNSSISSHLTRVTNIFNELDRLGCKVPADAIGIIMQCLTPAPSNSTRVQMLQSIGPQIERLDNPTPADIQSIITSFFTEINRGSSADNPITINALNQRFQHQTFQRPLPRPATENLSRSQRRAPNEADERAARDNIAAGNSTVPPEVIRRRGGVCAYCKGSDHWRASCAQLRLHLGLPPPGPIRQEGPGRPNIRQTFNPPQATNMPGPSAVGPDDNGRPETIFVRSVASGDPPARTTPVLDSGATSSVSGFYSNFSSFKPFNKNLKLNLADTNSTMVAIGNGRLKLPSGSHGDLLLPDVLYCPSATGTLISLGHLIDCGFTPDFSGNDIVLTSPQFRLIATYKNRTWYLDHVEKRNLVRKVEINPSSFVNNAYFWHATLGHASEKIVKKFLSCHQPDFNPKDWDSFYCESCKIAKSERRRDISPETIPKNEPLDLLVSDVLGPVNPDLFGNRFLLTIRDHASTYTCVYAMKNRSEVPDHIAKTLKMFKTHLNKSPKYFRCDNAQEYNSKTLKKILSDEGTTLIFTSPYTPEQNGEAERVNRTLGDMARTMMLAYQLGEEFWTLAYRHACYIHNRLPNRRDFETCPIKKIFNREPISIDLHPFGCPAIVHTPKEKRRKLDRRAVKAIFVGIQDDGRAWVFWNPSVKSLIYSDCATFPDSQKHPVVTPNAKQVEEIKAINLTLGEVPTQEICNEQDQNIEEIVEDVEAPGNIEKALSGPMKDQWKDACVSELKQMDDMQVWDVVDRPLKKPIISAKWVFAVKRNADNTIEKLKARYVVRGFRQKLGVNCFNTFAPTASLSALRLLLAIATSRQWNIHSFDISAAYLHSPIEEELYVEPPTHIRPDWAGKALRLKKALYGTRQAANCWWQFFRGQLQALGFEGDSIEQTLYYYKKNEKIIAIWLHVDDGLIIGNDKETIKEIKKAMEEKVKLKWTDTVTKIVGIVIDHVEDGLLLHQPQLVAQTIKKMEEKIRRPLIKSSTPLPEVELTTHDGNPTDPTEYQSIIGCLNYIAIGTRPDLSYAVNFLSRFSKCPSNQHWSALTHLCQYLKATKDLKLPFIPKPSGMNLWVDAGWGGEFHRSTSGFIAQFDNCSISWSSRRQKTVAKSTCIAEYLALGEAVEFHLSMVGVMEALLKEVEKRLLCDNRAAVIVAGDNGSRGKMRQLLRNFFFVNDVIREKKLKLMWVKNEDQLADIFTKNLKKNLHEKSVNKIFEGKVCGGVL